MDGGMMDGWRKARFRANKMDDVRTDMDSCLRYPLCISMELAFFFHFAVLVPWSIGCDGILYLFEINALCKVYIMTPSYPRRLSLYPTDCTVLTVGSPATSPSRGG